MHKKLLGSILFIASFIGVYSYTNTTNNIHPFLTYDSLISVDDVVYIAPNYDFVWAGSPARVANFKKGNPNIVISSYIPFNRDPDATHNLAYWKSFHADWVLYKCDQTTPVTILGDPNIGLDITNSAVLQWQVQQYAKPASQAGFQMMALDNVALNNVFGACGVFQNNVWVQRYSGALVDDQFRQDVLNWLTNMRTALSQISMGMAVHYRPSYSFADASTITPDENEILSRADAIVDGGGFTEFGSGFVNESVWLYTVNFMLNTQAQGKAYLSINLYPTVTSSAIDFILASYLMGKNNAASVYVTTLVGTSGQYGNNTWYAEFGAQIGTATSAMYQPASTTYYRRDFTNGMTLVNYGSADAVVDLVGVTFHDLRGVNVSGSVTIPPKSGVVLMQNFVVKPPAVSPPRTTTSASASIFGLMQAALLLIALVFLLF